MSRILDNLIMAHQQLEGESLKTLATADIADADKLTYYTELSRLSEMVAATGSQASIVQKCADKLLADMENRRAQNVSTQGGTSQ